jgi:uncharacterized membrane protein
MFSPATALKKFAIFSHRWTGVAFSLLFSWWFISGIFMMYFDYPEVKEADRLARAQPIDASRVRLTPMVAWASLKTKGEPDEVQLSMFDGRPAYWFSLGKTRAAVYADNGDAQTRFPAELNLRTAAAWTGQAASAATVEAMVSEDQWTVGGLYYNYEPLTKYSWPNGEHVYIPTATGQVVQYTTRASRLGAYLGSIPHWLYFTPLRRNGPLWSRVVIWLSGLATVVAVLGLVAGLSMYSPSRRYRTGGIQTSIPYAGPKRLHMILGLFFGFLACTWAFSGMLSMDPFPVKIAGEDPRIPEALNGQPFRFESFAAKHPRDVLAQTGAAITVKVLDFVSLPGEMAWLAIQDRGHSRVIPVTGVPSAEFDRSRLLALVTRASEPTGISEAAFIDGYDAQYLDRRRELPLPVLRVCMKDAQRSTFYIDPRTARIVGSYSSGRWAERWVYHALHSINLPWLYTHRPAWDVVVLILMLGGVSLSVTSVIIGGQLVWRRIAGR